MDALGSITSWQSGFRKVEHVKLIREYVGLSLKSAKYLNDAIVDGKGVTIELAGRKTVQDFAERSRELGAIA